ncbi:MAG TPA: heavy metal-binding domain-containing protein [Thermoproteota archaeon]|nr:heavy metal-binding domain-containing protein [Thermoproteota archaeon]
MPFCAKCGAQLSAGIAFCQNCGSPVSVATGGSTTYASGLPPHPQPTQILCTTAFSISGCRIVKELGIVRGLTVRTRGIGGRFQAGVSAIVGGKVDAYIDMCEQARSEALHHMIEHARGMGANAVIGMRYDTTEIAEGMDEVLAYGTAVVVEST